MRIASFLNRYALKQSCLDVAPPVTLENVRVASPCTASWEQMTGDDRVRHCQDCKLNVYNLSEMTRKDAERLIARSEGRLCVRFYRRADGTILTRDCPRGLRALTDRVSRIAGAVLTAMMAVTPVFAQSPAGTSAPNQSESKNKELGMDVTVVDPTNAVITNAKVSLCRCKDRATNDVSTDSTGVARFRSLAKGTYQIDVQAPGFKTVRQTVTVKKVEQLQIKLQVATKTTTVEVSAAPATMVATVGVLVVIENNPFPVMPMSGGRPAPLQK